MNLHIFLAISILGLFILGLIILKKFDLIDPPCLTVLVCICVLARFILYVYIESGNIDKINPSLICIERYIENSIERSDTDLETEINKILDDTLKDEKVKANISSYTNIDSQARIIKVKVSVGKHIYSNLNREYLLDLKTKKLEEI